MATSLKKPVVELLLLEFSFIVGIIFIPVVMVWLALGARIIWSATGNPETLDQIEGLLTALAVLSLPVSMGLGKLFEAFSNEIEIRKRDD